MSNEDKLFIVNRNKLKHNHYIKGNQEPDTKNKYCMLNISNDNLFRILINGMSGTGKTTLLCNYISQFYNSFDKVIIIVITTISYDEYMIDHFKKLSRGCNKDNKKIVLLNNEFFKQRLLNKQGFNIDDLKQYLNDLVSNNKDNNDISLYNLLICFDDIENLDNNNKEFKIIYNIIKDLVISLYVTGRSHSKKLKNMNIIYIVHNLIGNLAKREYRMILNESTLLVFKNVSKAHRLNLCKKYGIDENIMTSVYKKNQWINYHISEQYIFNEEGQLLFSD